MSTNMARLGDFVADVLGPSAVADTGAWGTFAWTSVILGAPGYRLGGGTDEILENTSPSGRSACRGPHSAGIPTSREKGDMATAIDLAVTDEQEQLRDTVHKLLAANAPARLAVDRGGG